MNRLAKIAFPPRVGNSRSGHIDSRLFERDAVVQAPLINLAIRLMILTQIFRQHALNVVGERIPLGVAPNLRFVKFKNDVFRITKRSFVNTSDTMSKPLFPNKLRRFQSKADFALLERRVVSAF